MSRKEISIEIQKILDELNDENLSTVLNYLKEVKSIDSDKMKTSRNLGKILKEDAELLKRLAQ